MICEKNKCMGCFACYNVCPKNAIKMVEDECGYIYPIINEKICIKCNACKNVCPAVNKVNLKENFKCYAARALDNKVLNKSTSGGIATIISEQIISEGGVVYGAAYDEQCEVSHLRITAKDELYKLQGSKYVHSYIKDTYVNVKKDLNNDFYVLFIRYAMSNCWVEVVFKERL